MASVLLTSAAPPNDPTWPHPYDQLDRLRLSASQDKHRIHTETDDPTSADIILFADYYNSIRHYLAVRRHPYYRRFRSKCYLYSRYDHPLPLLPGIYPSIERRWHNRQWTRSGGYLVAFTSDHIEEAKESQPTYLFSFIGAGTNHPIRQQILELPSEDAFLLDTSSYWPYGTLSPSEQETFEQRYLKVSHQSRFIVCPRGRGASSVRLFEALRMGRAPVIISDAWVPPEGPDWTSFSIRVPEAEIHRLPSILATRASDAATMGRRARVAWEDWFSVESTFHRTVEACVDMQASRRWSYGVFQARAFGQLLRPLHFRTLVRTLWKERPSHTPVPA